MLQIRCYEVSQDAASGFVANIVTNFGSRLATCFMIEVRNNLTLAARAKLDPWLSYIEP